MNEIRFKAVALISAEYNSKQRVFLNFVLSHYVNVGVEELDQAKLNPLLRLKYKVIIFARPFSL